MSAAFGLRAVEPKDGNPFDAHPALSSIWSPVLAGIAYEAIDESFDAFNDTGADYGAIFLVTNPNDAQDVWGITGFLPWPDDTSGVLQRAGLRWHGLLPERRGQGISIAIIDRMRSLANERYPGASHFVEFMPASTEHAATAQYFEKAGFKKFGSPERVYWSSDLWQEYVCDIGTPLTQAEVPPDSEPYISGP